MVPASTCPHPEDFNNVKNSISDLIKHQEAAASQLQTIFEMLNALTPKGSSKTTRATNAEVKEEKEIPRNPKLEYPEVLSEH